MDKIDSDDTANLDENYSSTAAVAEITTVTTVADVGDSLDGIYFIMQEPAGSVAFWIDTDDSGTAEPAHGADRSVEITAIVTNDTANTVATVVRAAINGDSEFSAPAPVGAIITVTNAVAGDIIDATAETSGFTVAVTSQGADEGNQITELLDPEAQATEAQHKSTLRRSLRSALRHKALANEILDSLSELQATQNVLLVKLDTEAGTLNDTDYESTLGITVTDSDAATEGVAQHKASFRTTLRNALAHKNMADEVMDAITDLQGAYNSALVQLDVDAGAGTGALTGLYTPFKVSLIEPDEAI